VLSGSPTYDLTDSTVERMRHRVASLPDVPTGARVVVHVGALAPEPTVTRILALHERRLHVDVQGTPFAVRRWLDAIRNSADEVLV
jgi:hypothetical protein